MAAKKREYEGRVNVYLTAEALQMLRELGHALYPGRKRVDGLVVETAIRRLHRSEVASGARDGSAKT